MLAKARLMKTTAIRDGKWECGTGKSPVPLQMVYLQVKLAASSVLPLPLYDAI